MNDAVEPIGIDISTLFTALDDKAPLVHTHSVSNVTAEVAGSGRHRILLSSSMTFTSGVTYNLSIYAKKKAQDWIQLNPVTNNWDVNNWANFDLNNGVVGNTGTGAIATIEDVGNGWFRCSLQCNCILTSNDFTTIILTTNNTNSGRYPSYVATGVESFYIWGVQFTQGVDLKPYYDNGQWETLTYTTATFSNDGVAEFYVDCDGTAGWINIDDWNTTTSNDSRGQDYWGANGVYIEPTYRRVGGSSTFTT